MTHPWQERKERSLLSTEAVRPLSPSASITTIGDEPGTSTGLEDIPEKMKRKQDYDQYCACYPHHHHWSIFTTML